MNAPTQDLRLPIEATPGASISVRDLSVTYPNGFAAVRDASFGPTIMVGLGGTIAEAIKDTTTRIAPISTVEAEEMLNELTGSALLDGWRGSPRLDRSALAQTIVRLAAVLDGQPEIVEIEINPLRVYPNGVSALDALIAIR